MYKKINEILQVYDGDEVNYNKGLISKNVKLKYSLK